MAQSWRIEFQPPPLHGNFSVYALSALGEEVWAVGKGSGPALVAHSAYGGAWELISSLPDAGHSSFYGVHETARDDVWAVGYEHDPSSNSDRTHIAHGEGTTWQRVDSPNLVDGANRLVAVAASGRADAWAVGGSTPYPPGATPLAPAPLAAWTTLALHWDGTHWTPALDAARGLLGDVCAVGPGEYWAVGTVALDARAHGGALVAFYAEGQRQHESSQGDGALFGVAATGPDDVWAVGQDQDPARPSGPLILHYDGHAWTPVAAPPEARGGWLTGVACARPDDAWAVGGRQHDDGSIGPLILHFGGTTWSSVQPPAGAAATSVLLAVTALPGGAAWAAGFASAAPGDTGYTVPLVMSTRSSA